MWIQFNSGSSKDNFYDLASNYIKYNKQLSKESRRTYNSQLTKINQFQNIKTLSINEVNNLDFIQEYKNYMIEDLDNKINTIAKSLGFIKSVINYGIRQELIQSNVFSKIQIKKELGKREYLTSPELRILEDYYHSNSINNSERNILSYYLFCCYTGLRFMDIKKLCWKDIIDNKTTNYQTGKVENWKTIEIKMHKTQIGVTIPLNKKALEYLPVRKNKEETDDIFRVISGQKTNEYLRKALEKAKIKKSSSMSFHTSRHTFATYALVCGMPIKFISKLLGHTDIKTTQIYTKVNKDSLISSVRDFNSYL